MDIATILLTVGSALGGGGTVLLWLEAKTARGKKKRDTALDTALDTRLAEALNPINVQLQSLSGKLDARKEQVAYEIKVALGDALEPVKDQLSILNTKIEPLWTALINMGINQATVMHQPDPRRAEIDALLEALQDELRGGPLMTADQYIRLRRFLTAIKTWEPGQDLGFPVLAAEPTSAAILLAIMGLSRVRRRQENRAQ